MSQAWTEYHPDIHQKETSKVTSTKCPRKGFESRENVRHVEFYVLWYKKWVVSRSKNSKFHHGAPSDADSAPRGAFSTLQLVTRGTAWSEGQAAAKKYYEI